jgi:hypothetical protein
MLVTTVVGASLVLYSSGKYLYLKTKTKEDVNKHSEFMNTLFTALDGHGVIDHERFCLMDDFESTDYGYKCKLTLPAHYTIEKFRSLIPALEQDTWSKIRFSHLFGRDCLLEFGTQKLDEHVYFKPYIVGKGLRIPFYTHFGIQYLDFEDEASCHLAGGGASRMGKTTLLRLFVVCILEGSNGHAQIMINTAKKSDFFMFMKSRPVWIPNNKSEVLSGLEEILEEGNRRRNLLEDKGDVIDLKDFRKTYPDEPIPPIFVIIDEFARFSDKKKPEDKRIVEIVEELIETFGYVDIHLILFSQRIDVKDVLTPRIRANCNARVALCCTDEANSNIILDAPNAAHLGGIVGRCVLKDGLLEVAHVPYVTKRQSINIGKRYEKHGTKWERLSDNQSVKALPSNEPKPISDISMFGRGETYDDYKSSNEKVSKRPTRKRSTTTKG